MHLSIIVPARNEADVLQPCLESLFARSEDGFALGEDWELFLVDDGSTDQTRSIALGLAGVQVLDPAPLPPGWTGKPKCGLDCGSKGARRMAPVYGCGYHSPAG